MSKILSSLICFVLIVLFEERFRVSACYVCGRQQEPDACRTTTERISSRGYSVTEYTVQTADEYLLLVVRIPGKANSVCNGKPVLMGHGFLSSASNFFTNDHNSSIGFGLADAGCDVWALNVRGNRYSRRHVSLDPNKPEFWDFTSDEMALYDLPAVIDYIRQATGQAKIAYVGYSMGGLLMTALLSDKPEFKNKVSVFIGVAPGVYQSNLTGLLRVLTPLVPTIAAVSRATNMNEFGNYNGYLHNSLQCQCGLEDKTLCKNLASAMFGPLGIINETRLPVYSSDIFLGTSINNLEHMAQSVNSGKFQKYDYGTFGNLKKYNTVKPPAYNIKNVDVPTVIISAKHDFVCVQADVDHLIAELGQNVIASFVLPNDDDFWDHLSFIVKDDLSFLVSTILNYVLQY